jgi:hypothetical protein
MIKNVEIPAKKPGGRPIMRYWMRGYVGYERCDSIQQRNAAARQLRRHGYGAITRHDPAGYPAGYYVFVNN